MMIPFPEALTEQVEALAPEAVSIPQDEVGELRLYLGAHEESFTRRDQVCP